MSTLEDVRIPSDAFLLGEFGGKPRYARYDLNAFAELERIFGSMEKLDEAMQKGSMKDVRSLLWVGLIWNEAILDEVTGEPIRYTLTQHEVGSWLTPSNLKNVMEQLGSALALSLPAAPDTASAASVVSDGVEASTDGWKPPADRLEEMKQEGMDPLVPEDSGTGHSTYTSD